MRNEAIDEAIAVRADFQGGTVTPVAFRRRGREHSVRSVNARWMDRAGKHPRFYFSVTDESGDVYQLQLQAGDLLCGSIRSRWKPEAPSFRTLCRGAGRRTRRAPPLGDEPLGTEAAAATRRGGAWGTTVLAKASRVASHRRTNAARMPHERRTTVE